MELLHWLDVQRIGEELAERHEDVDPLTTMPWMSGVPVELYPLEEEHG